MTATETLPKEAPPSTPMAVHIIKRREPGSLELHDTALCGFVWDRPYVKDGPMCEECVAIYRKLHPGWPIPRRNA